MKKYILVFSALIILATFFTACEQDPITNPADDITQLNADAEMTKLSASEVEEFMELLETETTEDDIESRCTFPVAPYIFGPYSPQVTAGWCVSRYRFMLAAANHNVPQDFYITIEQKRAGTYPIFDVFAFNNTTYANRMSPYYRKDGGANYINECEITARVYVRNRACGSLTKILDVPLAL